MRVLGIDCGGEYTGYGVVEQSGSGALLHLASGAVRLRPRDPFPQRLLQVYTELREIVARFQPDSVAVEEVFFAVNARSALKLGHVRGVALLAAAACGLPVAEYAPLAIKSAVVDRKSVV